MPLVYIPIEHLLLSKQIDVLKIHTARNVGSDHLPLITDLVVHLRDTFETFWISPTPENTSIASPARVKGVPFMSF